MPSSCRKWRNWQAGPLRRKKVRTKKHARIVVYCTALCVAWWWCECILHIVVIENKREEDDGHDRDTSHCPNFVCFNWSETSDHHLCNKDGLRKKKSNVNHGCEPAHQFVLEFSERMTISCFPGGSFPQLPILPCTRWREMCRAGTEHSAKMAVTRIQKVYVKLYRR